MALEPSTPLIWIDGWLVRDMKERWTMFLFFYYFLRLTIVNITKVLLPSSFLDLFIFRIMQERWTMFSTLSLVTMLVLPTFVRITRIWCHISVVPENHCIPTIVHHFRFFPTFHPLPTKLSQKIENLGGYSFTSPVHWLFVEWKLRLSGQNPAVLKEYWGRYVIDTNHEGLLSGRMLGSRVFKSFFLKMNCSLAVITLYDIKIMHDNLKNTE